MRLALGVFLAVGALGLSACGDDAPKPPDAKTVVLLFDQSDSTQAPPVRDAYVTAFNAVLESTGYPDALVAAWITDHSASEFEVLVNVDFAGDQSDQPNPLFASAQQVQNVEDAKIKKQAIAEKAGAQLRNHPRKVVSTDILGSISVAERTFALFGHKKNVLVLVSDMQHDTPDLILIKSNLTDAAIDKIITDLKAKHRIAKLAGVRVYIDGAGAPDDAKYRQIRAFWERYFSEAGATVVDYGAQLIRFKE